MNLKDFNLNPRAVNDAFYKVMIDLASDDSDPALLGWRDLESQISRFDVFIKRCLKNGDHVLDFGCGTADFYKYSKDRGFNIKYTGIDVIEEFLKIARDRYGDEIKVMNTNVMFIMTKFDWVFANGTFSVGFDEKGLEEHIKHLVKISNKGVCFNILDDNVFENDVQLSLDPQETYEKYTKLYPKHKVKLITGYTDDDFTIIIRK